MRRLLNCLFTIACTTALSGLAFYACSPDHCRDTVCLNGGSCEDGFCKCPPGFNGPVCEYRLCEGISCFNGGSCADGVCVCLPGFEGPKCEEFSKNKFLGAWTVTEDGTTTGLRNYTISVHNDTGVQVVFLFNLHKSFPSPPKAIITGDTLVIPQQQFVSSSVVGQGIILDDPVKGPHSKVRLRYKVTYSNGTADDFGWEEGLPATWSK